MGKRAQQDVRDDFVKSFTMYHQFDRTEENFVTPEDFLGFYSFMSMGIDSDALFELQLTSVWNLSDN
jgi:hypothetical protein